MIVKIVPIIAHTLFAHVAAVIARLRKPAVGASFRLIFILIVIGVILR